MQCYYYDMKEKTISDYIAKDNKALPYEERAKKFETIMLEASKELGVGPWATLVKTEEALVALPCMKDLWGSEEK